MLIGLVEGWSRDPRRRRWNRAFRGLLNFILGESKSQKHVNDSWMPTTVRAMLVLILMCCFECRVCIVGAWLPGRRNFDALEQHARVHVAEYPKVAFPANIPWNCCINRVSDSVRIWVAMSVRDAFYSRLMLLYTLGELIYGCVGGGCASCARISIKLLTVMHNIPVGEEETLIALKPTLAL